ncbi:hypothetical protein PR003_g654 [Phytophthora rubi]|uniref:Uncharacterized protein n=1 Tax=Phytophthora rubi TaxID=129364 RepID=A0A6A4G832_9STRA|nr:hypothetical protein PR002_g521 [Phytophthora rubi]KAE9359594.1 hypothetical protein PR003_g654 [Phytophthora rubi]
MPSDGRGGRPRLALSKALRKRPIISLPALVTGTSSEIHCQAAASGRRTPQSHQ